MSRRSPRGISEIVSKSLSLPRTEPEGMVVCLSKVKDIEIGEHSQRANRGLVIPDLAPRLTTNERRPFTACSVLPKSTISILNSIYAMSSGNTGTLWACKPLSSYRTAGPFPPRAASLASDHRRRQHSYDLDSSYPRQRPDPQHHSQASLPAYFLAGRSNGVTPTCSSAVYGAP